MRILFLAILLSLSLSFFVQSWAGEGAPLKKGIATTHALSPSELNELAVRYVTGDGVGKNYDQARLLWLKAAEHDHAGAQYNLGQMYSTGTGIKRNPVEAARWYQQAAKAGDLLSQFNLGLMYETGKEMVSISSLTRIRFSAKQFRLSDLCWGKE